MSQLAASHSNGPNTALSAALAAGFNDDADLEEEIPEEFPTVVGLDSTPVDPTEEAEGPPALDSLAALLPSPGSGFKRGALEMDWGNPERNESERLLRFSKGQPSNETIKMINLNLRQLLSFLTYDSVAATGDDLDMVSQYRQAQA